MWFGYYYSVMSPTISFAGRKIWEGGQAVFPDRLGTNRIAGSWQRPYGETGGASSPSGSWFGTYWRDGFTGLDYADQRFYASGYGRSTARIRIMRVAVRRILELGIGMRMSGAIPLIASTRAVLTSAMVLAWTRAVVIPVTHPVGQARNRWVPAVCFCPWIAVLAEEAEVLRLLRPRQRRRLPPAPRPDVD